MADPRRLITDQELDDRLRDLAVHLVLPSTHQLAGRVRAALQAEGSGPRSGSYRRASWRLRHGRHALIVFAACLALLAIVVVASPTARADIARLFSIPGVTISRVSPGRSVPVVVGAKLDLGTRTTLDLARRHARFTISVPDYASIAQPDEVYIDGPLPGQVSLVYRARTGFPRAAHTGVGLLITEFKADLEMAVLKKLVSMGSTMQNVQFADAHGVWLSGAPHFFGYTTSDGNVTIEPLRLAGNTLLWKRGGITYRLEGSISEATALRIAESMR
jgi:hypothetical protein